MRTSLLRTSAAVASREIRSALIGARLETLEDRTLWSASALDTSFNGTGKVLSTFGTSASFCSVVALPDGKVLAGGTLLNGTHKHDFLVARYNANGTPDTTFGGGTGRVFTDIGRDETAKQLLLTGGGKFAIVGTSMNSDGSGAIFAVARYNANGTLDTSFSGDGKLTTTFTGTAVRAAAAAILSDGKLLVVGSSDYTATAAPHVAFARYNTNGTLDTSFGGGTGKKTVDVNGDPAYPTAVAVTPQGQILLTIDDALTVARFTSSGALDTTFGGGAGWERPTLLGVDVPTSIALLSSGKFLVGGSTGLASENTSFDDFFVARFNSGGTLDTTFNNGQGFSDTDFNPTPGSDTRYYDRVSAIMVQPNGKIVAVGTSGRDAFNGPLPAVLSIARYNADGTDDTSYSGDGRQSLSGLTASAVAAAPGGKLLVVGDGGTSQAAVLRFNADFAATASIAGNVYNDLNGNGAKNTGEAGLSGWQVFADYNNDGFFTPGETVATTDSSGNYKISGLVPGAYRIREVRLTDYNRTQPAGAYPLGFYDITLAIGQAVTGKNFGNKHV